MNETIYCDKQECHGNKNGVCHVLAHRLDKKECPFYKTKDELIEQEEELYGFFEKRKWQD